MGKVKKITALLLGALAAALFAGGLSLGANHEWAGDTTVDDNHEWAAPAVEHPASSLDG